MVKESIPASDEAWDDETLGADPASMKVADKATVDALDAAAGTQLISIRMHKSMVDAFKVIAAANKGIGYQTLMKQILQRFIDGEMKRVWNDHLEQLAEKRGRSPKNKERPRKAA
jgi:predicted DNA binding CopG/RHH family protein